MDYVENTLQWLNTTAKIQLFEIMDWAIRGSLLGVPPCLVVAMALIILGLLLPED